MKKLFNEDLVVANVGLQGFAALNQLGTAQLAGFVSAYFNTREIAPLVASFSSEMHKRLDPQVAEVLRGFVDRLDERPNLSRWRDAVDAAARRAGLLVCGELEAAARMASTEPVLPDGPTARDKNRALVGFSVSPGYFAARRKLGVAVA